MTTLVRYTLFQIPGVVVAAAVAWAAQHWGLLTTGSGWLALALWVAKDIAVYPLVRQSYEPPPHAADALAGLRGRVTKTVDPTGYVMVRGERWRAQASESEAPLPKGASIVVESADGFVLRVRRLGDG